MWIKIKDRLPPSEPNQYLIVYNPHNTGVNVMLAIYSEKVGFCQCPAMDDLKLEFVTHWMEIELPYDS